MNFQFCVLAAAASILPDGHALTSDRESLAPSVCNNGYIPSKQCPVMLGKGFGPPTDKVLCDKWKEISS